MGLCSTLMGRGLVYSVLPCPSLTLFGPVFRNPQFFSPRADRPLPALYRFHPPTIMRRYLDGNHANQSCHAPSLSNFSCRSSPQSNFITYSSCAAITARQMARCGVSAHSSALSSTIWAAQSCPSHHTFTLYFSTSGPQNCHDCA